MRKLYLLLLAFGLFANVKAQTINIPNGGFKGRLLEAQPWNNIAMDMNSNYINIDTNNDKQIQVSEALRVKALRIQSSQISSLVGIEYFTNVEFIDCASNFISELDVSALTKLKYLTCAGNKLNSLTVGELPNLVSLSCGFNQLKSLNLSGLPNLENIYCELNQLTSISTTVLPSLKTLECNNNQLTTLNLENFPSLYKLVCNTNMISTLNIQGFTNLEYLYCSQNQIKELNFQGLDKLQVIECYENQLSTLNVSENVNLNNLKCNNNQLISIFMKNGHKESTLNIFGNTNLKYICTDENEINDVKSMVGTNCVVNSYCTFNPGGNYYTIQGNSKLDMNNDGCDVNDLAFPKLNFSITDGTNIGKLFSNTSGNYYIAVIAGTHTLTPFVENSEYFSISPTSVSVSFPQQSNLFTQDFCITPKGIHKDLEITLLPIGVARPGFDAIYKIIYKNIGTKVMSGSINIRFNGDDNLDFVSANPVISNQTPNNLFWDYTNLLPFESREIDFTVNINSPMETPPVNGGDILSIIASITPHEGDLTLENNSSALRQIVVNSMDPNDKTCLEGKTITPDMIGRELHYMIRFENTGTYQAQNIVVKDMIDTNKFDVSTLVPIRGSHEFVTRITEGNKVEFIFENINLPFDDANNDGFVSFKIKTRPTLTTGDSFSNTANIYFDYNAPIVTNTATTTIAVLNKQDFEFSKYFSLYPNPAKEVLNIVMAKQIEVSSINIYNTLGQVVIVIPNAQQVKTVDVSSLTKGNYFIKLNTNKGNTTAQFIKE